MNKYAESYYKSTINYKVQNNLRSSESNIWNSVNCKIFKIILSIEILQLSWIKLNNLNL